MTKSPWRTLLYKELEDTQLSGSVLDLGGSRRSGYHELLKGKHKIIVNNFEQAENEDLSFDLEKIFPEKDATWDAVLCINVLEHIYDYKNVVSETYRILSREGQAVFAVPFLIQVHPSPNDHWRFTQQTLERIFKDAGFKKVKIIPIGTGVFGAVSQMISNPLHFSVLRSFSFALSRFVDMIICRLMPNSVYNKNFYTLGYVIRADK